MGDIECVIAKKEKFGETLLSLRRTCSSVCISVSLSLNPRRQVAERESPTLFLTKYTLHLRDINQLQFPLCFLHRNLNSWKLSKPRLSSSDAPGPFSEKRCLITAPFSLGATFFEAGIQGPLCDTGIGVWREHLQGNSPTPILTVPQEKSYFSKKTPNVEGEKEKHFCASAKQPYFVESLSRWASLAQTTTAATKENAEPSIISQSLGGVKERGIKKEGDLLLHFRMPFYYTFPRLGKGGKRWLCSLECQKGGGGGKRDGQQQNFASPLSQPQRVKREEWGGWVQCGFAI